MLKKIIATIGVLALVSPAMAEPIVLKFASPAPAPTPVNGKFLQVWSDKVSAESNGTLKIEFVPGGVLGKEGQLLDRVKNGVVDIAWDLQGYYPGNFPKSSVVELPFSFDHGGPASAALWDIFKDGTIADEYDGVKVLNLWAFPNGSVMTVKPVTTMSDLKGMKFAANSPIRQRMISALGATPVNIPLFEWYQSLNRGVLDGVAETMSIVPPFKLHEVLNHYIDISTGGVPGFVFMNQAKFDSLPDAAKKAIADNSGKEWSRAMGAFWEGARDAGEGLILKSGFTVDKLPPAEEAKWKAVMLDSAKPWDNDVPNAAAVKSAFAAALKKEQAAH